MFGNMTRLSQMIPVKIFERLFFKITWHHRFSTSWKSIFVFFCVSTIYSVCNSVHSGCNLTAVYPLLSHPGGGGALRLQVCV